MANITGQELVDRLSDLLRTDIRDNLELAFEKTTFEMPSGASISSGEYFTFSSSITDYYVYFEKDGSTGNDPTLNGKTGIKVDILEADTSGDVATKMVSSVDIVATEMTEVSSAVNIITLISDSHTNITLLTDNNVGLTGVVVVDPKGQFDPNHLSTPGVPQAHDKLLIEAIAKKTLIEAVNKIVMDAVDLENTVKNSLSQYLGIIGDFVTTPSKKTDMEKISSDLLSTVVSVYKDLHGTDLDAPETVTAHISGLLFPMAEDLAMGGNIITGLASGGTTSTSGANIGDADSRKSLSVQYTVQEADETQGYITLASLGVTSIRPGSVVLMIDGGVTQHSDLLFPASFEYSVGDDTGNIYIKNVTLQGSDSNDLTNFSSFLIEEGDVLIILYSER
jgi:hypothetical protein